MQSTPAAEFLILLDRRAAFRWAVAGISSAGLARSAAAASDFAGWTDERKEAFLARAAIASSRVLSEGITGSERATLRLDGVEHDAHIQTVDQGRSGAGAEAGLRFRDSYIYNIAAYRIDRLLGWRAVPAAVSRLVRGAPAAASWWVDDLRFSESQRFAQGVKPPDNGGWNRQMYLLRVFDELIANADRNRGNLLITQDWAVRPIDHTRTFGLQTALAAPDRLRRCDAVLLKRLRGLTQVDVGRAANAVLDDDEIRALLARRDALVAHFDALIERHGRRRILYSWLAA